MAACSASMPTGRPSPSDLRAGPVRRRRRPAPRQLRVDLRRRPSRALHPLDAVLFDLGLSSYQLADPGGLQLRGRCAAGHEFDETAGVSALELIDRSSGESSPESSRRLVKNAVRVASRRRSWRRVRRALVTAADLATSSPPRTRTTRRGGCGRIHPATRTFQALRIAVNREVEVLRAGLCLVRLRATASRRPHGRDRVPQPRGPDRQALHRAREPRDCIEDPLPPVCMRPPRASCARGLGKSSPGPGEEVSGTATPRAARSCASPRSSRSASSQREVG